MTILLFGCTGQIGWELQRSLAPLGRVVALSRQDTAPTACGDFTRPNDVLQTVRHHAPHIIVNAAGYTAVDQAEQEPDLALQINATTPGLIAQEAKKLNAWMVHYSTDYVFNGRGTRPWTETDTPDPLNTYGRSQLAGEQALQAAGGKHLILRTSWVYSARRCNFVKRILRLAQERSSLAVVNDQTGAPTSAELIADMTAHMLAQAQERPDTSGLYHLAAGGYASRNDVARYVLTCAEALGIALRTKAADITATTTPNLTSQPRPNADAPTAARPLNSRLATQKLQTTFGLFLPPWEDGVQRVLNELQGTDAAPSPTA